VPIVPNVFDNEDLYTSIVLNGIKSPGQVTLSGHDRRIEWDVKSGPSLQGASTELKAIPPISFKASFYLVYDITQGQNDFQDWEDFVPAIQATVAGSTPKAASIYHPDLAANHITSVVLANMGGMVYDGKGGGTVVVTFQEYRPPRSKGGAVKPGPAGPGPDPNQDVIDILSGLTTAYQNTPGGPGGWPR
jgi:hypothetical protein